jgi:hypothetical protein
MVDGVEGWMLDGEWSVNGGRRGRGGVVGFRLSVVGLGSCRLSVVGLGSCRLSVVSCQLSVTR